jgi:hypothetical protein
MSCFDQFVTPITTVRFDHFVTASESSVVVDNPVRLPSNPRSVCHATFDHFVTRARA